MVKTAASEAAAPTVPAPEPTPSEAPEVQVEGGEPVAPEAPPAQEPVKPDVKALLDELPEEEREALFQERYQERLQRAEQSARDQAYARHQADQQRQTKANQDLQTTLQNLDSTTDDAARAQAIQAYARTFAEGLLPQRDQTWRGYVDDSLKSVFKLDDGEYRAAWMDVHRKAAKEQRQATDADFIAHMMGERYMPKSEVGKMTREEIEAIVEEKVGKRLAGQPSPVVMGPGQSPPGAETYTRSQLAAMTPAEYAAQEDKIKEAMWAGKIKDE